MVTIRPATVEDAEGIARVHVAAWHATYRGQIPDALLDARTVEERTTVWRAGLMTTADRCVYIALDPASASVVGFISAGKERTGETNYAGEFHSLYMHPDWLRGGSGRRLMSAAAAWLVAHDYRTALVWVLRTNDPARRFYERLGGEAFTFRVETLGGFDMMEIGYGYPDVARLILPEDSA